MVSLGDHFKRTVLHPFLDHCFSSLSCCNIVPEGETNTRLGKLSLPLAILQQAASLNHSFCEP